MNQKLSQIAIGLILALAAITTSKSASAHQNALPSAGVHDTFQRNETISGKLEVTIECENENTRIRYYVDTGKARVELNFIDEPGGDLGTGDQVTLKGGMVGDSFKVAESMQVTGQAAAATIAPNTFGEQKVLVLLVNFQNDTREPFTIAQANDLIFNQSNPTSVANYYREASYQQAWLTGNTFGYFTLPINSGDCSGYTTASAARQAATNAGINLAAYNRFIYVYPNMPACAYNGIAEIAGDEAWINGSMYLRTVAHELGHTFGLYHARSMDCGAQVVGGTCTTAEYGNVTDAMGYTGVTGQFNAFQKERLGWLNYGSSPAITHVQSSGNYSITANSAQDFATKALKIQRSSGEFYYVELRRLLGFDSTLSPSLTTGVVVTLDQPAAPRENYQLDMTPDTTFWTDAALPVGRAYTDSAAGFTITPVSVDNDGAVVNVTFGAAPPPTCSLSNPSVSVTPSGLPLTLPGGSVTYSVTVTNNNSSGCTANTFNLQGIVPAGWTWSSSIPSLTVTPGASATATVQVTSQASAASGSYLIGLGMVNAGSLTYSSQASANISVCPSLGVSAASNQPSYTATQTATITANITAIGTNVAGASVNYVVTRPDGSTAATGTAVSNTSGIAAFSYKFNRKRDPTGTYRVSVNAAVNGIAGNSLITFALTR